MQSIRKKSSFNQDCKRYSERKITEIKIQDPARDKSPLNQTNEEPSRMNNKFNLSILLYETSESLIIFYSRSLVIF